ncbi:glycoside hydrolase domain-containing protein [Nocardia sp. CY41]|uniref:glycoside hydrolase domain-containing protein n=1 Tax=Nocardia sp. CY41 TaxID=2608686 RepID=UPI00135B0CB4|nr:glycoside hydrolase domain-containing protein [Nocardia sp. CY41]
MKLLDFSAALIDPQAIKDAGYSGVVLYMSDRRPGAEWMLAKPATREYCDRLRAAGLEIVSNYQFGKGETSDWYGGYDGGVHHAEIALRYHRAAGGPDQRPIYAPVDANPTLEQWNQFIAPFLRGWASVVGLEWTGMYGNFRCINWALEDGVATWFWQHNWSGGFANDDHPAAHLHQIEIDKRKVGGVGVDVNVALKPDYGQWSVAPAPLLERETITVTKPDYQELDRMGDSASSRHGARIENFLLHTQEGNGTAESLANYLNNPRNGVSYHYTVRDGVVVDVVDTDLASWSVLDANSSTINLCFAGSRAGWSRDEWMAIRDDLRIAAWLAVQDAQKYGYDPLVIAPPYERRSGISDHRYVTDCLGIGTHTDVGPNFPWDIFEADVCEFATGAPAGPPPNAINDVEAATPWLGARRTVGENATPDGIGRYAEFDNGHIYWHPATGAHAIPASLFGKYSELGWEQGPLGYPTTECTVLPQGEVQGFQGGALYGKDGDNRPPVWVHGAIRDRWHRSGSETGPFGWPLADEEELPGGEVRQRFEHGQIIWPGRRDTVALLDTEGPDTPVPDRD